MPAVGLGGAPISSICFAHVVECVCELGRNGFRVCGIEVRGGVLDVTLEAGHDVGGVVVTLVERFNAGQ